MKHRLNTRWIEALGKSILCFAALHVGALGVYAVTRNRYDMLNPFRVLDLDLFFPILGAWWESFFWGSIFALSVYGLAYRYLTRRS